MCFLQVLILMLLVVFITWGGILIRKNREPQSTYMEKTEPSEKSMKKLPLNDMLKCVPTDLPSYESALKKPPPLSN